MKDLEKLLRAAVFTPNERSGRWGLEICLWSDVGWGKSSRVESFAEAHGVGCKPFMLSRMDVGDVAMLIPEAESLKWKLNEDLVSLMDEPNSILFIDEYSECPAQLQALSMSLMLERSVGNKTLPGTVVPVLAANPAAIACGGFRMERPAANRLTHIDLDKLFPGESNVGEWAAWLSNLANEKEQEAPEDPDAIREGILEKWAKIFKAQAQKVAIFIKSHPALLQPRLEGAWRPKTIQELAFPTKRSNAKAARILAAAEVHDLNGRLKRALLEGTVGVEWSASFLAWEANFGHLPCSESLLDGNESWTHDKSCPDRAMIVLNSCLSVCEESSGVWQKPRVTKLWEIMAEIVRTDPLSIDVIATTAKAMVKLKWYRDSEHRRAAAPVLSKINVILVD